MLTFADISVFGFVIVQGTVCRSKHIDDDDDDDVSAARSTSLVVAVTDVRSVMPGFHAVDNVLVI